MSEFNTIKTKTPYDNEDDVLELNIDDDSVYRLSEVIKIPGHYTFSIWYKTNKDSNLIFKVLGESVEITSSVNWKKFVKKVYIEQISSDNNYIDIGVENGSIGNFYEAYLAEGESETSWSDAPEDIEEEFISVRSEIKQTAEKIDMSVSNIKGDISNINIQIGKIEQSVADNKGNISSITTTVDGIKTTVDKHGESISEIDQKADKISQQVTDVESNLSSKIELTAGEITQKVDAVESGLNSKITQTAGEINQKIEDTKTNLSSEIKQTSDKITQSVNDINKNLSTRIDQTSNEIQLTAKNLKDNYYNKEETNAKFKIQSDSITSTVKKEVTTEVGKIKIGSTNLLLDSNVPITNASYPTKAYTMTEKMSANQEYTCRLWGNLGEGKQHFGLWLDGGSISLGQMIDNKDGTYSITFTGKSNTSDTSMLHVYPVPSSVSTNSTITKIKLEKGNKATDWSPAPEEMATADSLSDVNNSLTDVTNGLQSDINSTNKNLQDIQNSQNEVYEIISESKTQISSLTQRADGFTMDFKTVNETVKQINNQFVTERDERYKYIKFIDGEIWLGKEVPIGEDDFKLVIKNDRISFLQNKVEVAYMSNNKLYVTDIHVTNTLQLGKFVWGSRANGNVGLRWIGN